MKPPSFDYADPRSLEEAVSLVAAHDGEAKVLAGGQSLVPLLNMRMARPGLLVDIARIPRLDRITEDGDTLAIGAMTRQRDVELSETVRSEHPLLHAVTQQIAHPQNRNQGTVGGSVAHADPAAEYPALALALDAEMKVAGPSGHRKIRAADFFVSYLTTSMADDEILTEVRFPKLLAGSGWSIQELARRHGDFALAGAVATLTLDGSGLCSDLTVALFGVGATPVRASAAESAMVGEKPGRALFEKAGQAAAAALEEPLADVHASSEFRRHLAGVMTARALAEAAARAVA